MRHGRVGSSALIALLFVTAGCDESRRSEMQLAMSMSRPPKGLGLPDDYNKMPASDFATFVASKRTLSRAAQNQQNGSEIEPVTVACDEGGTTQLDVLPYEDSHNFRFAANAKKSGKAVFQHGVLLAKITNLGSCQPSVLKPSGSKDAYLITTVDEYIIMAHIVAVVGGKVQPLEYTPLRFHSCGTFHEQNNDEGSFWAYKDRCNYRHDLHYGALVFDDDADPSVWVGCADGCCYTDGLTGHGLHSEPVPMAPPAGQSRGAAPRPAAKPAGPAPAAKNP